MPNDVSDRTLSLTQRREVFYRLVDLQDQGVAAESAKAFVAGQYEVALVVLAAIEQEGLENDWPPP